MAKAILTAGAYALTELLCGIGIGGFFQIGRAEPDAFLAARPALLLLLAILVRTRAGAARRGMLAAGLMLAVAGESLLLWRLGGGADGRGIAIQLGMGALLAGGIDLLVQAGRRGRVIGGLLALAAAGGLIWASPLLRWQQAILAWITPPARALETLPALMVVTGLPIVRGEGDIGAMLQGRARPAASWRWLQAHFAAAPVDYVTAESLRGRRLLLLAQPRAMAPEELVAIDDWVRAGGRALVLADPALRWDSLYPIGDPRAPPAVTLLDPLMTRWGVRLDLATGDGKGEPSGAFFVVAAGEKWRLRIDAAGHFVALDDRCRTETFPWLMRCSIGRGTVLLVADADLTADRLWAAGGDGPKQRTADNGPLLGAWLDGLAGISRDRRADMVRWIAP